LIQDEKFQKAAEIFLKPDVKFRKNNAKQKCKQNETIMQSYAIILNYNYNDFNIVWDKCKILLYRNSRAYMVNQQKPIKLRLGINFTIFKPKPLDEGSMDLSF
jgi:hypothetical protein